jgi:hypothetical protein
MKQVRNIFFAVSFTVLLSCSRQEQTPVQILNTNAPPSVQAEQKLEPVVQTKKNDLFKNQLMQFLTSAYKLNAATEIGTSKDEMHDLFVETKGQFDLAQDLWPDDFCIEGKMDFEKAVEGWTIVNQGRITVASDDTNGVPESRLLYWELLSYQFHNPAGQQLLRFTSDSGQRYFRLDDEEGAENNNISKEPSVWAAPVSQSIW